MVEQPHDLRETGRPSPGPGEPKHPAQQGDLQQWCDDDRKRGQRDAELCASAAAASQSVASLCRPWRLIRITGQALIHSVAMLAGDQVRVRFHGRCYSNWV